jgi:hypothetical protein
VLGTCAEQVKGFGSLEWLRCVPKQEYLERETAPYFSPIILYGSYSRRQMSHEVELTRIEKRTDGHWH